MEAIENAAYVSVGRACGFAGLAVFCLVWGLSFEPVLAASSGGALCLFVALILVFYAWRAPQRSYKRTELWLILEKQKRPPAEVAQQVIGEALRETYIRFARQAAIIAFVLLLVSLVLRLDGAGQP